MTFQSHKCPNAQPDVIAHRTQPSALRAFNQTLLLQSAMIHFNSPRAFGLRYTLSFSHPVKARRPVFRCAVRGANPKYFNLTETFEPADCAITAAQSGFGHGLQLAGCHSDLAVGFEPRQKMPAHCPTQLEVFNRRIPTVETHRFGIKPALEGFKQHLREMVVFRFAVAVFIKDAIIYRDAPLAVGPEQRDQIDARKTSFSLPDQCR